MARPAKALINLAALQHNYRIACELSGTGKAMPIIKANAYGHGAIEVARALEPLASAFGVACIEEAMELREAGINIPVLLLQGAFSAEEVELSAQQNFWLMVASQEQAGVILEAALDTAIKVWLKVDSGMNRLGVSPNQLQTIYPRLVDSANVQSDIVVATHFACADELDNDLTRKQMALFNTVTDGLPVSRSLANSAGMLAWPESRAEWNRPGYMLFGNSPISESSEGAAQADLKPVMTLQSAVIALRDVARGASVGYGGSWCAPRDSRIATVTIGYGDGYPRHAPSGTPVLINGQRAALVGRVSMDMITVDVTDLPGVQIGDEVILWGEQLSVNEVAHCAGTIGYE